MLNICAPATYTITVTWTANDACNNNTTKTQTITVVPDTEKPSITVPAPLVLDCGDISETADPSAQILDWLATATATDNCDTDPELTYDFNMSQLVICTTATYTITVTWTATDACNNNTTKTQTITVVPDTEKPSITVPAPLVLDCENISPFSDPSAAVTAWLESATASDNCDTDPELTYDFDLTTLNVCVGGTLSVTWTATDACNNSTTKTQTITVIPDTEAPDLVGLPTDVSVNVVCADDVPAVPVVTATDNCTAPIDIEYFEVTVPGACLNQYQVVRTWTAEDFCGNSTTFVQTINVYDNVAPELAVKPIRRHYDCIEDVEVAPYQFATDNCGIATVEFSETSNPGNCPNWTVIERRWVAYDLCGNSSTWEQIIDVRDTVAPVMVTTPVDRTYECVEDVEAAPTQVATDNCGPVFIDFSESTNPGDCVNKVVISRRWIASDLCGNTTEVWQHITVFDDEAPVLATTPADRTYDCIEDVEAAPVQVATDNCGVVTYNFEETENPGTCLNQVVITRRWYAYDLCGNSVEHWQTITVNDTEAPVWTSALPGDLTLQCGETVPAAATLTASDNCNEPLDLEFNETYLPGSGPNDGGKIVRTWTAQDDCGNAIVHTQTITINDTQAPVLVGLPASTMLVQCSEQVPAVPAVTATDNCQGTVDVELVEVEIPGTCPNQYQITRTWTAVDFAGNSTIFVQTITVSDTQAPVWTSALPGNMTLQCGEATPAAATLTASDNCNAPVDIEFNETYLPGSGPNDGGKLVRTWTAEDDCGNAIVHTQTITINDTQAPVFAGLPSASVSVSCSEQVPAVAAVTASDNCQGTVTFDFSEVEIPGTCANQYSITRTWTATDFAGNSTVFTQTITVSDTQAPTWVQAAPANVSVSCAADVPAVPAQTASDNCNAPVDVEFNESIATGSCPNKFTLTRTWTAEDDCGNSTTRVQVITVNDDVVPVMTCPANATAQCSPDEVPVYDNLAEFNTAGGTATDNCGLNSSLFGLVSQVKNGNVYTRTYRVTDLCGNTATCVQTVTVLDTEKPVFVNCPANITVGNDVDKCGSNVVFSTPIATDNCDSVTVAQTAGLVSGSLFPVGTTTVTFLATDPSGNTQTCQFTITVMDMQTPTAVCKDLVVNLNGQGQASVVAAQIGSGSSDNCPAAMTLTLSQYAFDCSHVGNNSVTLTVTDGAGNTAICVANVLVRDLVPPTFTCPAAQTVSNCDALVPNLVSLVTDAADNCGVASVTQDPVAGLDFGNQSGNVINVTVTVLDVNGNIATCVVPVTIADIVPPVFVNCPANITVGNDVDKCGANVVFPDPIATDNCVTVGVTQTGGPASGTLFPVGTSTTISYLATDGVGNTATCQYTITVTDMQAPNAICQNVTVNLNAAGNAGITAFLVNGGSNDNCTPTNALTLSVSQTAFTCANVGANNVTLIVTDAAGNKDSCVATVTVRDLIKPTFTCPANVTVNDCDDVVPDFVSQVTDAADNCGVATITQNPVAGSDFGQTTGNSVNVTITVTDVNGNTATCVATVTIVDNVPPTFVNCPTTMVMIGNDPDECSGKLNWGIPVADDNCALLSVVQTGGPASGTVVPVGVPQTVTYKATDAAGNTSLCTFQVQVVDTQNPEFDADILMPGNITVECHAIPAPFVLTTDDVHDNCTAPADLVIVFTETSTQGINPALCTYYDYTITRTWTITDLSGNALVHTQKIKVQDKTAPVAKCQNITVTLDKFGVATITAAQVNNNSTDNCAPASALTLGVSKTSFNCSNLGANTVTLTVTDPCGNSSTCTAIVTVVEGAGSCAPQFSVATSCLNNATDAGNNGQFIDVITVKALAGQTWTLTTNTGLHSTSSAAPPAAPTALPAGTAFTMGSADGLDNDGDGQTDEADEMVYYTLKGVHVEAIGYAVSIGNNLNQTGTISNKGYYPNPYFKNLYDPFCIETDPFTIEVGEYNNAQGVVTQITVNGVPTTIFDAKALGLGFHTVMATFDAGSATTNLVINGQLVGGTDAQAQADPGCQQKITKVIQITSTPTVVVCNDLVNVSLDADCVADIFPDEVLEGTYACFDDYTVVITYPAGTNSYNPPNRVDATHAGKTVKYTLVHALTGNACWGEIKVEDKLAPALDCPADITIACSESTDVTHTGDVGIQDCSTTTTQIDEAITDNGECGSPRQIIVRTFIVTDKWGNQAACTQTITVTPFDLNHVVFPADVTVNCESAYLNPNATKPDATGRPSINGAPIGNGTLCSASIGYTDVVLDICAGSYEIYRTWQIGNTCLPLGGDNPKTHVQRIRVKDFGGPQFACPGDVTVSVNPFGACCATAPLPDMIVSEGCSTIKNLEAKVTGTDPATGNIITFTVQGQLADFAGNNYWNPDTMAVFPYTQCLPMGVYTVRYTAEDGCGNISTCEFKMTIADLVPPVSTCDEFTQVALGGNGEALVNASTFDDGSYDNCAPVQFKARRMNDNDCQDNNFFYDQVKFCCSDVNDTITVVFRVWDIPVPAGTVDLEFGEGHYNDCMVQVLVEDKIKPTCVAPANVTVSCENFDPSLWAYGFATAEDNCCIDTITATASYTLFDTVCNRGTITRTFRSFDCGGQQNTCTQRVVVNYVQDYFVKFPNDVIVTTCDGTGNYGEPTFFGEDCELLGVSFEDELFTVVPDACFKIERTWTIINWCTYNPNAGCIEVPNPNPNATLNNPANLTGPTVSPAGTPAPWNPTVIAIAPGQTPTNYSTFWAANANCYKYKQIIKIIDTQDPIVENCPDSTVTYCDLTANAAELWNDPTWYDPNTGSHNLCEGPTDLNITATDLCSNANLNFEFLLFLDLNGDGVMETVVSSTNPPAAGVVNFGNAQNPNFTGGVPAAVDQRPVPANQKYLFTIQETTTGTKRTASLRWNNQQSPATYVVPELPYGTHKIKWIVSDGCGNETVCEYTFVVKDCKAPTVVCVNGLSVNLMPTKMITLWDVDFLQYTEDNCTPSDKLVTAIRRSGTGTGFPTNPDGSPQKSVTFTCDDLGTQLVELWSVDLAGNADYCETYVIVQDNIGVCTPGDKASIAGFLKTEVNKGLEDGNVELQGMHPALPPVSLFNLSDKNGIYGFPNAVPFGSDYTVTPTKDNDPLNGVTTFDLVLINKHILGLEPLNSPYKMIAADANNSRSITTFDIVELRKLILGIYTELPNNTSWRFVDKEFGFPNPLNPFQTIWPETKSVADVQNSQVDEDFVAVKVGDVNLNAVTSSLTQAEDRTNGELLMDVQERKVKAGEAFTATFRAAEMVKGYQFTLYFPNLEVLDVTPGADMTMNNFGIFNDQHALTTSFSPETGAQVGEFTVTFRARKAGLLSEMLTVSSRITKAEAYAMTHNDIMTNDIMTIALRFASQNGPAVITGVGFELYQNAPNPWTHRTQIGFHLPEATEATLTVYDETGRILFGQTGDFGKGYNAFTLDRALLNTTGMLYYKVETPTDSAVKKMIQAK